MQLKENTKNPNIVEDELGNVIFEFKSIHPQDREEIIRKFNDYEKDVADAFQDGLDHEGDDEA